MEGKKEGAVDGALENPSVFTPAVDEELTYREPLEGKMRHSECPQSNNMYFQCAQNLH